MGKVTLQWNDKSDEVYKEAEHSISVNKSIKEYCSLYEK